MANTVFTPEGTNSTRFTQDDHNIDIVDTINGVAQKNARMWQIIALASLSAFFVSLGVCIYTTTLPQTIPVIVTVDTEGKADYVGAV